MNWEDENIDKLFQEASANSSFEFKEEYWTEMEALLPKKKKRRIPYIWIFSAVAGCIFTTFILFSPENSKENKIENSSISKDNTANNVVLNNQTGLETKTKSTKPSYSTLQKEGVIKRKSINKTLMNNFLKEDTKLIDFNNSSSNINNFFSDESKTIDIAESVNNVNNLVSLPFPSNFIDFKIIPGELFISRTKKWSMYFDLSTSMGQSMIRSNENGSSFSKGFGIGTGISYTSNKWSISTGISSEILFFDNLIIKERAKVYGFGVKNYENKIAYNQIYSFETPLMIGFKQKNHLIQFGVVPTLLIGSKMSFESKVDNQLHSSSIIYGYSKGLVNFGLKPTIGYIYKITPTLQIGANVQLQLFSQIESNVFEGIVNNTPLNGQFFIRKSIFIK